MQTSGAAKLRAKVVEALGKRHGQVRAGPTMQFVRHLLMALHMEGINYRLLGALVQCVTPLSDTIILHAHANCAILVWRANHFSNELSV